MEKELIEHTENIAIITLSLWLVGFLILLIVFRGWGISPNDFFGVLQLDVIWLFGGWCVFVLTKDGLYFLIKKHCNKK